MREALAESLRPRKQDLTGINQNFELNIRMAAANNLEAQTKQDMESYEAFIEGKNASNVGSRLSAIVNRIIVQKYSGSSMELLLQYLSGDLKDDDWNAAVDTSASIFNGYLQTLLRDEEQNMNAFENKQRRAEPYLDVLAKLRALRIEPKHEQTGGRKRKQKSRKHSTRKHASRKYRKRKSQKRRA